jgi:hypothetical protein
MLSSHCQANLAQLLRRADPVKLWARPKRWSKGSFALKPSEQTVEGPRQRSFGGTMIAAFLFCALAVVPYPASATPMSFRTAAGGNFVECPGGCRLAIEASGEITDSTPNDLVVFLRANPAAYRARPVVLIDSLGGKIAAGLELGRIFRKIGVTAIVARISPGAVMLDSGSCFSACVYALMGASTRIAPGQSRIGVHRMFSYDGDSRRFDNGEMAVWLKRYAGAMGVSPELVAAAERGGDAMRILTPAEIVRWRLARVQPGLL